MYRILMFLALVQHVLGATAAGFLDRTAHMNTVLAAISGGIVLPATQITGMMGSGARILV